MMNTTRFVAAVAMVSMLAQGVFGADGPVCTTKQECVTWANTTEGVFGYDPCCCQTELAGIKNTLCFSDAANSCIDMPDIGFKATCVDGSSGAEALMVPTVVIGALALITSTWM